MSVRRGIATVVILAARLLTGDVKEGVVRKKARFSLLIGLAGAIAAGAARPGEYGSRLRWA